MLRTERPNPPPAIEQSISTNRAPDARRLGSRNSQISVRVSVSTVNWQWNCPGYDLIHQTELGKQCGDYDASTNQIIRADAVR